MNANYPKKCWYVAATSAEVADPPLERRVLDRDIVLWRGTGGTVTAFEDRCAHRAFPLSRGRVVGDQLVCAYHGCAYDVDGRCVRVPTQPEVPTGLHVQTLPVLEAPPFVWIWGGPPNAASGSRPPRTPWLNDPAWSTFSSAWQVSANYMMLHEHYLDFSYAPTLHASEMPPGVERLPALDDVEVTETTVSYTRVLRETPLADWEAEATGLDRSRTYTRREQETFASPAMHVQRWDIEHGDDTAFRHIRTHAITPETPSSTHVFMHVSRNYATQRAAVTTLLQSKVDEIARRDTETLEVAAAHAGYDGWRSGVEFRADAAVLRARRIVAVMLAKEAGRSAIRPGLPTRSNGALA
jgi:phenylpropionate dioxygenase-like ring-hydroxylating dioxygenase large terminal subunit